MTLINHSRNLVQRFSVVFILLLNFSAAQAGCPPYEIPQIKTSQDYSKVVYIDPSASSAGSGTQSSPLTRLPASLERNTAYLIKRGTTHPSISRLFHSVLIGSYGQGAMPIVQGLDVNDNSHFTTFRDLDIARKRTGSSDKVVELHHRNISSNITIAYCKLRGIATDGVYPYYILHHSVNGLILFNNEIYNSHNNGWWLTSQPNIKIIRNWFHHLNRGGENSTTNTGDGIQAQYGMEGFYFAGNIIDKSNSLWKYALMLNGEHHYNVVEYNTFYPPKAGAGGAGVRWLAQEGGVFRKNLVQAIDQNGKQLVVPFDTWDPHANKPAPYGIRDNHIVKVPGAGVSTNGVILHSSNAIYDGLAAYQSFLQNNPGIGLYGSDITPENFWNPPCQEQEPAAHKVSFEVTCNHHKTPIADAIITFDQTDLPPGQYTLADLAEGTYNFTISATGHEAVVLQDVEISEDISIPVFLPTLSYQLQLSANPQQAGSFYGQGTYQYKDIAKITAQANDSYSFVHWSENGQVVSTQLTQSLTVKEDRQLVAVFTENQSPQSFVVQLTTNDPSGGTVTGQGTYSQDEVVKVAAVANENYQFIQWSENGLTVSTQASYSFSANQDRQLVAHFAENQSPQSFVVQLTANDSAAGAVTGQGTYPQNHVAQVTAVASENYQFIQWTENGQTLSTQASFSFPVTQDRHLVAHFSENQSPQTFGVQVTVNDSAAGTITGGGTYSIDKIATVTAVPNDTYHFAYWSENNLPVSTQSSYSFMVKNDRSLVAHFTRQTYTLNYIPQLYGTLSGSTQQMIEHGANGSPVTAIPDPGYTFISWNDGSVENPRTDLMVAADLTVYAIFELTMDAGDPLEPSGGINIFPVPVVDVLNAHLPAEEVYDVSIINNAGQVVSALGKATKGSISFNLSALSPGLYFIRFSSASDMVTHKFLKQ